MKDIFNPKKTKKIIGFNKEFLLFNELIEKKKFPKVLMLSGQKGIGKFTFINHFLHYYFDKVNYDIANNEISKEGNFFFQNCDNFFPNISNIKSSNNRKISIEDIRNLKDNLSNTPLLNDKRFIVLDDIETFNTNSLNAILKIIEEPADNNFFILINNKTKPLLETIKSRCLELKIFFDFKKKENISNFLFEYFKQNKIFKHNIIDVSPGLFLKYNYIFTEKKIDINENITTNLDILIKYYKKEKDFIYKDLIIFYIDYCIKEQNIDIKKNVEKRSSLIKAVNNFFLHNLSLNSFLTTFEGHFSNE